jgi:regulator of protease activity HflC (stomatin/prohibitin superfamily)
MLLVLLLAFFLAIALGFMLLKWYVLGREIMVEREMAVIVRRVNGRLEALYRGWHKLNIGDKVCIRLPLRLESGETNQEEVSTCEGERVRLGASYRRFISDPVQYYLHRRSKVDFINLNRWALTAVIQDFRVDDVYNVPNEINATVEQLINEELHDYGEQIGNYLLDEAIWPETNERWLRGKDLLPSPVGRYWNEVRRLRRRHR